MICPYEMARLSILLEMESLYRSLSFRLAKNISTEAVISVQQTDNMSILNASPKRTFFCEFAMNSHLRVESLIYVIESFVLSVIVTQLAYYENFNIKYIRKQGNLCINLR